MYSCRPAQSDDYAIVCGFPQSEDELFYMFPRADYPLTAAQLSENASTRWHPTVVVTDEGEVAGYANMYGFEEGKHAYLGNVIVSPRHRGLGAAAALIETMIDKARSGLNVPRLLLVCHHSNPRAILFYDKFGFKPFGLKRMTNRRNETIVGILMELNLQANG